jgi:transcriptional regulator with XRE-family HTH domain
MAFASRVKEIRRSLHLSQKEFAESIGLSPSYFSEVESGKFKPGFDFFVNIVKKYDVNIKYLATGEGEPFLNNKPGEGYYGEFSDRIEEMIRYIKKAPLMKFAILEFYTNYIYKNKEAIEGEVERYNRKEKVVK